MAVGFEVGGATNGLAAGLRVRLSELDSERFGVRIARADGLNAAEVRPITAAALGDGAEMIIARCPADDFAAIHALERAGYLTMETLVHYRGPVTSAPESPQVRQGTPADADAVGQVARVAFATYAGHYHADPRLADLDCVEAYASWAHRCATGEAADDLVVAEVEDRVVGFQAHRSPEPGVGQLLLVCVAPQARGLGLYRALGAYAQRWSAAQGHSQLWATCHQANLASHRVFIGLGLRPARVESTFHGWADDLSTTGSR